MKYLYPVFKKTLSQECIIEIVPKIGVQRKALNESQFRKDVGIGGDSFDCLKSEEYF